LEIDAWMARWQIGCAGTVMRPPLLFGVGYATQFSGPEGGRKASIAA